MLPSPLVPDVWRYVDCGAVDAFENNAQMAVLARSAGDARQPILQTSVWGTTHLNVGWFDDVDDTLDLDACQRLGIQVIRRPFAGGGTAFYDRGCAVMWGVLFPKEGHEDLDALAERFAPITLSWLRRIGLDEVEFQGSGDLRWKQGRKLGGNSAGDFGRVVSIGGFLNVRSPDIEEYLKVVRVPDDKFRAQLVKDMREYVCTAEEVRGQPVAYEEFRDALVEAVHASGVTLERHPRTDVEQAALKKISNRIATDDSVRRISSTRFRVEHEAKECRVGFGNYKGKKLCRAGVALDDRGTVVGAMMAGDMHVAPPDTLDRVAAALAGAVATDHDKLRARIAGVFEGPDVHQAGTTTGVTTDDLLAAVVRAITEAHRAGA